MKAHHVVLVAAALVLAVTGEAEAKTFFKVDFEDGTTNASVGKSRKELQSGAIDAVPNPHPDAVNSSTTVARVRSIKSSSKTRAEFASQRLPTNGETLRYRWSMYFPKGMLDNVTITWLSAAQWKSWPCEVCKPKYDPAICGGCGGIFNEIGVKQKKDWHFRWRAEPNCEDHNEPITYGSWVRFEMLIYWTKGTKGYVKLWRNGKLVKSYTNIRTLFTSFEDGTCDIYWAVGLYTKWSGSPATMDAYIDDIEISDDVTPPQQDAGVPDAALPDAGASDLTPSSDGGPPSTDAASDASKNDAGGDGRTKHSDGCAISLDASPNGLLLVLLCLALWIRRKGRTPRKQP